MHVANLQFMWQNRPFERCLSQELFAILPNASNSSARFGPKGGAKEWLPGCVSDSGVLLNAAVQLERRNGRTD